MSYAEAQYTVDSVLEKSPSGIPPLPLKSAKATNIIGEDTVTLTWNYIGSEDDGTIYVENNPVCYLDSLRIVKKQGSVPQGPNDGKLVAVIPLIQIYNDGKTGYVDTVTGDPDSWYYGFFPMSDQHVYNMQSATVQTRMRPAMMLWGYHQAFVLNPDETITYPEEVENSEFTPMMTNEGTGTVTAGDWLPFLTDTLKNQPAAVRKDGTLDYWLDPNDYTKKLDGSASDYNNTSYDGGMFAWLNKIFMKEVYDEDGEGRFVYFSDGMWDEDFRPVGYVDDDNNELEGVWLPMGLLSADSKVLIAGTGCVASKTTSQEWDLIQAFSPRGRFLGGGIVNVFRDLCYMLYKNTDIQKYGGYGRCNQGQASFTNQVIANNGVPGFKGTSDKKSSNMAFHSQALFYYGQWLRDPYTLLVNGVLKYSPNYSYDITGATYQTASTTSWTLNGGWHYGQRMEYTGDGFGSTPKKENTASTTTGLCDGLYCDTSGTRVSIRFGPSNYDLLDGPATLDLSDEASNTHWNIGVGLLLLPPTGYAPQAA